MCKLSSVLFHGDTIYCVDNHGEPFVPLRPVIENLGVQWGHSNKSFNQTEVVGLYRRSIRLPKMDVNVKCSAFPSASSLLSSALSTPRMFVQTSAKR